MRNLDLANVEDAPEYKRIVPGGYIAKITTVEDYTDKEYLKIEYDIAEGEFKNYYVELYSSKGFWGGSFFKSYKEKALPYFKAFITAIENSNKGYRFDNNENKLVNKFVGLVVGEEEYQKNDGSIGTRLYVDMPRSVEEIRKGNFTVPALKKLKGSPSNSNSSDGFFQMAPGEKMPWDED